MRQTLLGEWNGHQWVRVKYFDRYPNSQRALWWQQQLFVHIRTEHGFWRPNAQGYTLTTDDAGTYTFTEAMSYLKDLGPEKQARIWSIK